MKYLLLLIAYFIPLYFYGQEIKTDFDGHKWEAPYHLPVPKNWTIERFLIPISFAPQIPYKGVEDIRFAPGWAKAGSKEYWSYAFLWYLDGAPKTSAPIIANNLKAYYTGLIRINTDSVKLKALPEKMRQVKTSFKKIKALKGDLMTFNGTVEMVDFMLLKSITLNCIVHVKACPQENKTVLFYQLSPQPRQHKVWESFAHLWSGFSCKK